MSFLDPPLLSLLASANGAARIGYGATTVKARLDATPTLTGPNSFSDLLAATGSLVSVTHRSDGSGASSTQAYGVDIHNMPAAGSALVVHQYSNVQPAVVIDNTDTAAALKIKNTHNAALNPSGPATATGDFLLFMTENNTDMRLRNDFVWQMFNGKKFTVYSTSGSPFSVQTHAQVVENTAQIERAYTLDSGSALKVLNSGGTGVDVRQSGPGNGVSIEQTGTGSALAVRSGVAELMSVSSAGLLKWTAAANVQTTVGAAGGASALPATPTKYLKVIGDDGVTYVIPAYAAA